MDINSMKINLGHLERYVQRATKDHTIDRSAATHVVEMFDEQMAEIEEFVADAKAVREQLRETCSL